MASRKSLYPEPNYGAPRRRSNLVLLIPVAVVLLLLVVLGLRVGGAPELDVTTTYPALGGDNAASIQARSSGRGLQRIAVSLRQGENAQTLVEQDYDPPSAWKLWASGTASEQLQAQIAREQLAGLEGGEAVLEVSAWPARTWLRRPAPTVTTLTLPIRRSAPRLAVLSSHHYPRQGGSETVVYRVSDGTLKSGVEVGEAFFPGHPVPGREDEWFSLFAVPFDVDDPRAVRLVATNDAGMTNQRRFVDRLIPSPPTSDDIELSTSFLEKVVPEILAATPEVPDHGDLLQNYLEINGNLRAQNATTLREVAANSRSEFLWQGAFQALPNGQVMSSFADRRTYRFEGAEVDRQTHLGFDLASVRKAPVPAANGGVVALARYFGIYGNTVVLDHGYGLMSLYAHLSAIDVEEGQEVAKGVTIGRTGETGLAGGDHLHYTVLVGGEQVNPTEWWDAKWINDRLREKLGADVISP